MEVTKGVYCFTFPNGKKYVGYTCDHGGFPARWSKHKYLSKMKKTKLYTAIRCHGWDNIEKKILVVSDNPEYCKQLETSLISAWNLRDKQFGYNDTKGGDGLSNPSEETRKKISKKLKGNSWNLGRVKSEEHMENWKKSRTGHKVTQETRDKISNTKKGKPSWNKGLTGIYSEESLAKMRAAKLGKKHG